MPIAFNDFISQLEKAKPTTQEDIDKFFNVPEDNGKIPLQSHRMMFIDLSDYNKEIQD